MDKRIIQKTCLTIAVIFALSAIGTISVGNILYVDDDAIGANDGSSWENAYVFLQDALADADIADKPVEIHVAQGVYKPDQGANQTPGDYRISFQLINEVTIRGGYAGFGEPNSNARDIETFETILSGDIYGDDIYVSDPCDLPFEPTRADNVHTVVIGSNVDETAVLDGFTITGGHVTSISMGPPTGGAGMHIYKGSPTILNCIFTDNYARQVGGGMYNRSSSPTLINCKFILNFAESAGGAMCNMSGWQSSESSDPKLINCTFENNYALQYGGGVYNIRSNPTLTDCTFSHNRAVAWHSGIMNPEGGGMYNSYSSPVLSNCEFSENLADFGGGGICNTDESSIELTNCTFRGNSASRGGGLLNLKDCGSTLIDCKFIDNTVIECGGGMSNHSSNTTLVNCIFKGNKANDWSMTDAPNIIPSQGGGMTTGGNPVLSNCTFQKNCAMEGAGIYITGGPKLIGCTFTSNSAENYGGGICKNGSAHELTFTNCIFSGNFAEWGGGVFLTWGAKMAMANCTFAGNLASIGRDMACNPYLPSLPGYIKLTNCILWNGKNAIFDPDPYALSSAITYSNIQGGWPGEGNIDVDPLFADPGYWSHIEDPNVVVEPNAPNAVWIDGDYHLMSQAGRWDPNSESWVIDDITSLCIDAGDPNSPIGREPSPNGDVVNMGAYGGTVEASNSYFSE